MKFHRNQNRVLLPMLARKAAHFRLWQFSLRPAFVASAFQRRPFLLNFWAL